MTKAELVRFLETFPDEMEVHLEVWDDENENHLGKLTTAFVSDGHGDEDENLLFLCAENPDQEIDVVFEEEPECQKPKLTLVK